MRNCLCKFKIFRYGFTLAEVLITLVIVGVVAAFTIPTVINTYVESSTVAKVKKALSILGQAKKLAEAQNGSIEGWDFGEGFSAETNQQLWNYLKSHISVAKDCGSGSGCYNNTRINLLNGGVHNAYDYNTNANFYKIVLADGGVVWFRTGGPSGQGRCSLTEFGVPNACACFYYDINGDKKPNTFGKDVFYFIMNPDGVYPSLVDDCNKTSTGYGCSGYIIRHNNADYLH